MNIIELLKDKSFKGTRKDIRKQIGKTFGDIVHITFCER